MIRRAVLGSRLALMGLALTAYGGSGGGILLPESTLAESVFGSDATAIVPPAGLEPPGWTAADAGATVASCLYGITSTSLREVLLGFDNATLDGVPSQLCADAPALLVVVMVGSS